MQRRFLLVFILAAIAPADAHAFTAMGHLQITRAALHHLEAKQALRLIEGQPIEAWLKLETERKKQFEATLLHATVDLDFQPDLWGEVLKYGPVAAAKNGANTIFFTSLYHYLNMLRPGIYWARDGFAYRDNLGTKNDQLLALPFSTIHAELSPPLGGHDKQAGDSLGQYRRGFKGDEGDWQGLYSGPGNSRRAVFPPAFVPAELAFDAFVASPPADISTETRWTRGIPVVSGLLKGFTLTRKFWQGQVRGLPSRLHDLGTTLHLIQDMAVPHHTQSTMDWCHQDFEEMADQLNCGRKLEYKAFQDGSYDTAVECRTLYDAALVDEALAKLGAFDETKALTVPQRLMGLAAQTVRWRWGDPSWTTDFVGTALPDGKLFSGDRCAELFVYPEVRAQLKRQYNLAVAATVVMLKLGARGAAASVAGAAGR